jgi:NADPH-dependent glutamate synthase beta subunit-like oxidoreductase/NAD-dependent dihydropyrimidine dehydrogenase PreA subunit
MIRTVDQSICIGCGTCQRVCPLDVFRLEVHQPAASPCNAACPVRNDIREINYLLEMGSVNEAAGVMLDNNPLASVTGRVCPAFCESECARNQVDAAVNISALEQFLGDYILDQNVEWIPRQHVAPIAVVGSGPAGLSCAYFLTAEGFRVTVFEAKEEPGGMMRYGIPEYRLPRRVIVSITERLQKMGVKIRCGETLNKTFSLEDLQDRGFGAVFLAPGVGKAKEVLLEGMDADGIFYGIEFLEGVRTGRFSGISLRVAVVGGGDVAMDAAQSALKLGAESVTIVTLEDEEHPAAFQHNVETARAAGIDFLYSHGVRKIIREGNKTAAIEVMKCINLFDEKGAFAPAYDPAATSEVEADTVIFAIGQETDLFAMPEELMGPEGLLQADSDTCQTLIPNVFAAGDAVTGSASVAEAIGGGKRAARAITYYIRGLEMATLPSWDPPITERLPEDAHIKKATRYEKRAVEQPGNRGFFELYEGFDLVAGLAEVDRCLCCGAKAIAAYTDDCMTCFGCDINCPVGAIFMHPFKEILPRALRPVEP